MEGMTRKRKWMFGLLALGVGALVLDRTLLGPPEEASASDTAVDGEDSSEAAVETVADRGDAAPVPLATGAAGDRPADLSGFAQRLSSLPEAGSEASVRADAFELPADWVVRPLAGPVAAEEPAERTALARAFHAAHTLNGTMSPDQTTNPDGTSNTEGVRVAVVDGKPYQIGDVLDGFELLQVANRMALWRSVETGEMVVLRENP